jgi:hypothetical protein
LESILRKPFAYDRPQRIPPRLIEKVVKTTMYPDTGAEPLLYPFLLLEAKREKDSDGFQSVEVQTALPIRHALSLQLELHRIARTCGNGVEMSDEPLVWFFAYCGEDWRIYAAFKECHDITQVQSRPVPQHGTNLFSMGDEATPPPKYVSCP